MIGKDVADEKDAYCGVELVAFVIGSDKEVGFSGGGFSRNAPHSAQNLALAISSAAQRWPHSPQNIFSVQLLQSLW